MAQKNRPGLDISPSRIRALREALGLDQRDFGRLVGEEARINVNPEAITINDPPQEAISRWEVGPGELYGSAILRIEERAARLATFEKEVRGGNA